MIACLSSCLTSSIKNIQVRDRGKDANMLLILRNLTTGGGGGGMSLLQVGELFAEAVRADRSLSAEEATEILNRIDPSFFPRSDGCRDQSAWQKIDQLMSVLETILLTLTDEQSQAFITVLNFIDEHEIPLILGDLS
jgi:hypothetical protein